MRWTMALPLPGGRLAGDDAAARSKSDINNMAKHHIIMRNSIKRGEFLRPLHASLRFTINNLITTFPQYWLGSLRNPSIWRA